MDMCFEGTVTGEGEKGMLQELEQECFRNGTRTSTTKDNNAVEDPPIGRTFCHDKICNLSPPLTKVVYHLGAKDCSYEQSLNFYRDVFL